MLLKDQIKSLASTLGYHACGIAGVNPFEDYRASIHKLAQRFPESAELCRRMERRAEPLGLNPWARAIVVCVRRYGKYAIPESVANHIGRNYLCDRRIKDCPDTTMPKRMKDGMAALGIRVRTGGVPSREAAVRAGIVQIGKNGFAYAPGCGSWINIEAWMIDAALEPDNPSPLLACPEGCHACLDACRTKALAEPYVTRIHHCIAYLTYEAPEPIPSELESKMGPWIYGCDDCQRVCPMNQGQWSNLEPAPWITGVDDALTPAALAVMDQDTYAKVVHPLFGYIPLNNLDRWHTNARRALKPVRPLG
jgi:epoxyqueuosine reductase